MTPLHDLNPKHHTSTVVLEGWRMNSRSLRQRHLQIDKSQYGSCSGGRNAGVDLLIVANFGVPVGHHGNAAPETRTGAGHRW